MSDNLPFEVQSEIIKHLPVKSLLRFRSVSIPWKSLIDSPNFITIHTSRHPNQPHHHRLLVAYHPKTTSSEPNYISIADDDGVFTFTSPQIKLPAPVPSSINLTHNSTLVGTSRGLICLCICHQNGFRFVLWNPSIRKSIPIPIPIPLDRETENETEIAFGFGVCPATNNPKLVLISNIVNSRKIEVFSLNSGEWRVSSCKNPPNKSVRFDWCQSQVAIDRFVYWFGTETNDVESTQRNVVISFDLSSEEFAVMHLPDNLAVCDSTNLYLCKRSYSHDSCDSLAVVKERRVNQSGVFDVWVMENGDSKGFEKAFAVKIPYESGYVSGFPVGFNRNDEVMMVMSEGSPFERKELSKVVVYKPFVECIEDVGIEGEFEWLVVCSYIESLLLLDLKDTLSDEERKV